MIPQSIILQAVSEKINGFSNDRGLFASTRDVFNARLQAYITETEKWLEAAVVGEIGNNTFDHNFKFLPDYPRGAYFNPRFASSYMVIADFGRGIKDSLLKVRPGILSDVEAVNMAFTLRISGRYPEQRGNGLKFVLETIQNNNWSFFFQSGTGCCNADGTGYSFSESSVALPGCLAILFL